MLVAIFQPDIYTKDEEMMFFNIGVLKFQLGDHKVRGWNTSCLIETEIYGLRWRLGHFYVTVSCGAGPDELTFKSSLSERTASVLTTLQSRQW